MAVGIATTKDYGQIDLWDFYEKDRGGYVPCGNLTTLLYFLCSPGTREASVSSLSSTSIPSMTIELTGPEADDRRHLRVSFSVISTRVKRTLTEEERSLFWQRLAEFNGRKLNLAIYEVLGRPSLPK